MIQRTLLGLTVPAFSGVLALICLVGMLVAFTCIRYCWLRSAPDPYAELNLGGAIIVGRSSTGPVFGTQWRGSLVAVKRMYKPGLGISSEFDEGASQNCGWSPGVSMRVLMQALMECFFIQTELVRRMARLRRRMHMHHANIVPILGVSRGASGQEVLAIMPRMMAGTIADSLAGQTFVNDFGTVANVAADVANAMHFFHLGSPELVGKNMKPHHLLLDDSFRTMIGVSFRPPNLQSVWAPPECLRGNSPWTKEADVYAFSMLLYTLVQGRRPFEGRKSSDLLSRVKEADEDTLLDARPPLTVDSPFNGLIARCWAEFPKDRPSFADVKIALMGLNEGVRRPRPSFVGRPSMSMESEQSQHLLHGMFPDHVRRLLEAKLPVPTEQFACVTIFFSDIKGFTEISSVLQPEDVKSMLDRLYTFMDEMADRHQVHKMETIGDAFVGVTNVMKNQPDHAARMAAFALVVMDGASQIPVQQGVLGGANIQLRIGMHSGPICAGVVGRMNLRYCLFGHTMNIASRMESSGEPGKIQISRDAAALISKDAEMVKRVRPRPGIVDVKGQGEMRTCWLLTNAGLQEREEVEDPAREGNRRSRRESFLASLPEHPHTFSFEVS